MRNLTLVLVFVALLIGLVLALNKVDSRVAIAWGGAATLTALSLPAAVLGEWLAVGAFLVVGLVLTAGLHSTAETGSRGSARQAPADSHIAFDEMFGASVVTFRSARHRAICSPAADRARELEAPSVVAHHRSWDRPPRPS